jgi:hypothetical protein
LEEHQLVCVSVVKGEADLQHPRNFHH